MGECLLAVLGREEGDDDDANARASVGAERVAEFLRLVVTALTKKE